jgi:hypothetical protein
MSLKISRILHAGYILECDHIQIAFDPIFENPFSVNCHAFPGVKFDHDQIRKLDVAAVFISHYHDDHCSFESLNLLNRKTPIYLYCVFEELALMIRELGFVDVHHLQIGVPIEVGPFVVIPKKALDADVDSIFHIQAHGLHILNVVDSWIDPETVQDLSKNAPWDMILWPFQTMRELEVLAPSRVPASAPEIPPEWIQQLTVLNPKFLVPSSCQFKLEEWSWYNNAFFPISYLQFQKEIESAIPKTQVIRLDPSTAVFLDRTSLCPAPPLGWIQPLGTPNGDYDYKPVLKPSTTAETARHLPSLTDKQMKRVFDYCQSEIPKKFGSLEISRDSYFSKPRTWRLFVYDHAGEARSFTYQIDCGTMKVDLESHSPLAWCTEVPIFKLYGALELGESLTSMYIRINDIIFDPDIEQELQSADITEDPLIRCLFTGIFGAYQRAQLQRLKNRVERL